jgi:hypothetical protein
MTARSQDTMIRALREANNKLRQENAQLRDELARAIGDLGDVRRGTASPTAMEADQTRRPTAENEGSHPLTPH